MLELWSRSIARAAGVEIPDDVRILPENRTRRRTLRDRIAAIVAGYRRWRDRRATYNALASLSDYHLRDIGLHRGMLERAADDLTHIRYANDNRPNWRDGRVPANDNLLPGRSSTGCA